jgi:hypothetical protein
MIVFFAILQRSEANFCPAITPGKAELDEAAIRISDVETLLWRLNKASPGVTFWLSNGIYTLAPHQSLVINSPKITLRGASGNRDAVVIEGGDNNISVNADDFTVADVTLRSPRFHNIQVRGEKGVLRTKIYNVHMLDAGQQFIKVSAGDGTRGKFADDGLVACSLIEYSTYSRGTDVSPPGYTNGVDILAGRGWVVRDNIFRRIRSEAGPAGPTILVWKNAADTIIQRNLIVDCWRGIALGLSMPDRYSRGGSQVIYDHRNGLVEDNVFLALHERADAAIENNFALNSRILHNTVYYNENMKHETDWAIEYRFPPTTVFIANNLTNLPIRRRSPSPVQASQMQGNKTNARGSWFQDIMNADYHLSVQAPAINQGVPLSKSMVDIDGDPRPHGVAPDAGADEAP